MDNGTNKIALVINILKNCSHFCADHILSGNNLHDAVML